MATWCRVRGGVWNGLYGNPPCEGAADFTEENIPPFSEEFERRIHNACEINAPALNWGSISDSYQCWSFEEHSVNGVVIRSGAKLPYAGKSLDRDGQCTLPWQEDVYARRDREPVCPGGTYLRYLNNERTAAECVFLPKYHLEAPITPGCDNEGNPCNPATGVKVQHEV
ncbi:MAG TPA: hypothetical protein EYP10_01285, partial [Armatimonadetes bacterium]|nr:hypothetical protein [Armatimonadota bacterium]